MLDSIACALVKGFSWLLCRLPPTLAVWIGRRLGGLAYWVRPKRARIGVRNLQAAFDKRFTPWQARRTIRRCFREMGAGLVELLRLPVIDAAYMDRYITVEGQEHFEAAVGSGRPVILLTGHFGNWELCSIVAALQGHPILALARAQQKLPKLYRLLVSYRESKGCRVIHKGSAMRQLLAGLDARQLIGIVGDQASRQGLFVDFFGRPALFATGPFELAYTRQALIVPAFIHRLRGPRHRLVIEPSITLDGGAPKPEAVRDGITRFAVLLARHITEDPAQWLWVHKRWKHTPARRLLVLSDGKAGHLKQSLAVAQMLRERSSVPSAVAQDVVEVRYRSRFARAVAVVWAGWMPGSLGAAACLRAVLQWEAARPLLTRAADVVISCGAAGAPINLLCARLAGAKSVVLMNPAPLPLYRFSLVVAPRHDRLPRRRNLLEVHGAVTQLREETLREARDRLAAHPRFRGDAPGVVGGRRHPVVAVMIGGDSAAYRLSPAFAEALATQVLSVCEEANAWCLVTTSRRTSPEVERVLAARFGQQPRCRLLLLASRDALDGTMEGMLGWADLAVVTGESVSMVTEACASGRQVVVVEPALRHPDRQAPTKARVFLRQLAADGFVRLAPLPEAAHAMRLSLAAGRPPRRLDDTVLLGDALARLL